MEQIEIADYVHHRPSGEDWIVARVTDEYLWPAGWPPGRAKLSDCTLLEKATPERRAWMLDELRKLPHDDERRPADNASLTRGEAVALKR